MCPDEHEAEMRIRRYRELPHVRWALISTAALVMAAGCATSPTAPAPSSAGGTPTGTSSPAASQESDTGTTRGDVPDNAVFLTYRDPKLGYSIQYVEGWQVSPATDGVAIRDKDSSELVQLVAVQGDVPGFVSGTDLPALRQQAGFHLVTQDSVTVGGKA